MLLLGLDRLDLYLVFQLDVREGPEGTGHPEPEACETVASP